MPYKNALSAPKSDINIRSFLNLANSSNALWQFAIFLSMAIVLQALGSNRSVYALSPSASPSQQSTSETKHLNSNRGINSSFLPRIFNSIATAIKFQPVPFTPKLAPLQPIVQSPRLYLADNKALTKPAAPRIHQVKQGETITAIANEYQVSSKDLIKLNQLANSNVIFVDQRLAIPNEIQDTDLNTYKSADLVSVESPAESSETSTDFASKTLPADASNNLLPSEGKDPHIAQLKIEIEQLRAQYKQQQTAPLNSRTPSLISATEAQPANLNLVNSDFQPQSSNSTSQSLVSAASVRRNLESNNEDLALALPPLLDSAEYLPTAFDGYIWPAQGVFTSGYGWRWGRLHRGIDIAAPVGTPIVAAAAGKVISAGWHSGYGNLVKLEHLDGSITYYAHNHRNLVTHGQKVNQGEQIAEMGSTGHSTGSHLHFEIHLRDSRVVDPLALLGTR